MTKHSLIALLVAALAPYGAGCASDCTKLNREYDAALKAEPALLDGVPEEGPLHLGIVVRAHVLDEVVARAVTRGLGEALEFTNPIALATGQKIEVAAAGDVANVGLNADAACEECLRVDGRLGGEVSLTLPVLGRQKVPLAGTFSVVAPVDLKPTPDGAQVRVDLSRAAQIAKSHVDPEVTRLPPTWWRVLENPLSKLLLEAMTKNLEPVPLFTVKHPDLGIEGLKVAPATIRTDARRGLVFVGFRTNVAGVDGAAGLRPEMELGKGDDIAVGISRDLLTPLSVTLLSSGTVSRTWTTEGEPDETGPIRVTVNDVTAGDVAENAAPVAVKFRVWHLPEEGKCWWGDVAATGVATARENEFALTFDDATLERSSLPGVLQAVARWTSSSLVEDAAAALSRTFVNDGIAFAGGRVEVKRARLFSTPGALWYRTAVQVTE